MQSNSTASDKAFSAFELCHQNQPLFGDSDLSLDEEENEAFIFCGIFTDFCKQSVGSLPVDYQSVCSLGTQISPHHFTNLPPPHSHVVLYL